MALVPANSLTCRGAGAKCRTHLPRSASPLGITEIAKPGRYFEAFKCRHRCWPEQDCHTRGRGKIAGDVSSQNGSRSTITWGRGRPLCPSTSLFQVQFILVFLSTPTLDYIVSNTARWTRPNTTRSTRRWTIHTR